MITSSCVSILWMRTRAKARDYIRTKRCSQNVVAGFSPRSHSVYLLQAVVHVEFDRMGRHAETRDFLLFQRDIGIDHIVAEDATLGQETAILVQMRKRLVE